MNRSKQANQKQVRALWALQVLVSDMRKQASYGDGIIDAHDRVEFVDRLAETVVALAIAPGYVQAVINRLYTAESPDLNLLSTPS